MNATKVERTKNSLLRSIRLSREAWDKLQAMQELFVRRVKEAEQFLEEKEWGEVAEASGIDFENRSARDIFGDLGA